MRISATKVGKSKNISNVPERNTSAAKYILVKCKCVTLRLGFMFRNKRVRPRQNPQVPNNDLVLIRKFPRSFPLRPDMTEVTVGLELELFGTSETNT